MTLRALWQLAIAVNAVVVLGAYSTKAYIPPLERARGVLSSAAVGVCSALIGSIEPWVDLAAAHCTGTIRVVSCRVVSCRVVSCRVVSCRVVSCRVVSCR